MFSAAPLKTSLSVGLRLRLSPTVRTLPDGTQRPCSIFQSADELVTTAKVGRERRCSLGTWNVLNVIREARTRGLPHAYLGYYVAGCPSMVYKMRFGPNQLLGTDGQWHDFQS